jgi:Plasmid pRiA4b ORF-3-like protein
VAARYRPASLAAAIGRSAPYAGTVEAEKVDYPGETFVKEGKGVFSGKARAAICIAGARNGPPEDCGGIPGYYKMRSLKQDAQSADSEEDAEMLEWLGDWDPEYFQLGEINQALGRIRVKKALRGET